MVKSIVERGGCYVEVLDTDGYYLANRVPIYSSVKLEEMDDDEFNIVRRFTQHIWQPEFVLCYAHGKYQKTWYVDPYKLNDGHVRVGCALVHYTKSNLDIHSKDALAAIKSITQRIMNAAVNVCYTEDGEIACNILAYEMWTEEMHRVFSSVGGDHSWIG